MPLKQQKTNRVHQERPVVSASSSDSPSNIPHVSSSPISITEVLASTYGTASHAPHLARHSSRGKSVDLNSRHDAPSTFLVYSRSNPSWVSLPLTPHFCTRSWYVLTSGRRRRCANPRHYSLLVGSRATSSFVPKLPEIPEEEESDNDESLDIGVEERQVHFENNVTVHTRMTASEIVVEISKSSLATEN